jgi:cytochrome c-type biogenesis protein CcmH/NrfF
VTPWHLGTLHPVEQALTVLLAFGPFLVLGVVVVVRRRQDAREEEASERDVADPTPES